MNKQELIKKYKSALNKVHKVYGDYYKTEAYEEVLKDLKRLDEPQEVTVPQFVADLIEYAKIRDWDLEDVFLNIANELDTSEISEWFYTQGNMDVIARAWLDGYTVEKEKKYRVKVRGVAGNSRYLKCVGNAQNWIIGNNEEYVSIKSKHTRKELEDAGFGWVFDCEGIEIEEVEG
nr:MAG TPA: Protein of unknown function (DUF1642) [Caudoviricetes sp.]